MLRITWLHITAAKGFGSSKADSQLVLQIECSSSGLCPGTTALVLTTVTAPVITLVTSTYLSSVVEVKQVSMPALFAFGVQLHCSTALQREQSVLTDKPASHGCVLSGNVKERRSSITLHLTTLSAAQCCSGLRCTLTVQSFVVVTHLGSLHVRHSALSSSRRPVCG